MSITILFKYDQLRWGFSSSCSLYHQGRLPAQMCFFAPVFTESVSFREIRDKRKCIATMSAPETFTRRVDVRTTVVVDNFY